jgi:hypothetical protein
MQGSYGNGPASKLPVLMRLQPKPLLSFLLNPFGIHARSIEYRDGALIIDARRGRTVHLQDLADPPSLKRGLLGTTVRIRTDDGIGISLKGTNHQNADTFAREVRKAWTTFNLARFEEKRGTIDDILDAIDKLGSQPGIRPPVFFRQFLTRLARLRPLCSQNFRRKQLERTTSGKSGRSGVSFTTPAVGEIRRLLSSKKRSLRGGKTSSTPSRRIPSRRNSGFLSSRMKTQHSCWPVQARERQVS